MERIYFNHLPVKSFVIVIFTLFFTILFSSCENFMDSSSVKDEINKSIYIANHECPVATVEEPTFSDEGVAKDKAIKISFSIPVDPTTFEENYTIKDSNGKDLKKYYMNPQWSSNNKLVIIPVNKTNLIDLSNSKTLDIILSVSQGCQTKDELPITSAINYKFRIKDEISSDEYPEVKVEEPTFTNDGVAKDKDIIINFTVPVNTSTFNDNYSILDSYGNDLKEYYIEPQWSEDNMLVTISPDKTNLIELGTNKTIDIIFSLSKECKTDDELPIKKAIEHKFRIKDEIESDEFPVVTVESPILTDEGATKDKDIIINFTVPVDPNTFNDSYLIVDSYGKDLKDYYLEPEWSNG